MQQSAIELAAANVAKTLSLSLLLSPAQLAIDLNHTALTHRLLTRCSLLHSVIQSFYFSLSLLALPQTAFGLIRLVGRHN